MNTRDKIIIGIDQSYQDTGVSVGVNGNLVKVNNINYINCENNSEKRGEVGDKLSSLISSCLKKSNDVTIIIEKIRLSSQGFVNIDYIKSIGALNAIIVDTAKTYNVNVYSVDTRAWKSKIIGTSKGKKSPIHKDDKKVPTIEWCIKKGYECYIKDYLPEKSKVKIFNMDHDGRKFKYNDNKADSIGLMFYGFYGEKDKMHLEH